jgi:tRNA nucleotidyltransferase (CCA-adding enzyme)
MNKTVLCVGDNSRMSKSEKILNIATILDTCTKLIPDDVLKVLKVIQSSGYEAYIVGGCVRDIILGYNPHDWDICTNCTPDKTKELLNSNDIKVTTVGIEYGTVVALMSTQEVEVTTYRKDGQYSNNRKPDSVTYATDIIEDLSRRDFTINAMAIDPINMRFVDRFNGLEDIQNKVLRCIGKSDERFQEDALRILRALRFAIKYQFRIETLTSESMLSNRELLDNISKERITNELLKILQCKKEISQYFLDYHDIIFQIIPELKVTYNFDQRNQYHRHNLYEHILTVTDNCKESGDFIIRLAALLHDIGKPEAFTMDSKGYGHFYGHPVVSARISKDILEKRLVLTTQQKERVLELVEFHDCYIANTRKSVKKAMNRHGVDFLNQWIVLKQADIDDHVKIEGEDWFHMPVYVKDWMQKILDDNDCFSLHDLKVNGTDIMSELNLKPCKQVGIILHTLLDKVINEEIQNEREVLLQEAYNMYNNIDEEK